MKGLKGRELVTLDPVEKDLLESFARRCDDWDDRVKRTCPVCWKHWWKPRAIESQASACPRCCTHQPIRGFMLKWNGEACPQHLCLLCGKREDIRRNDLGPILDVCIRNNATSNPTEPCSRCGATTGTELHHWAPKAIFNDADDWPMSPLCPTCHRTWHQAMRDAAGFRLEVDRRIGESPWGVSA